MMEIDEHEREFWLVQAIRWLEPDAVTRYGVELSEAASWRCLLRWASGDNELGPSMTSWWTLGDGIEGVEGR